MGSIIILVIKVLFSLILVLLTWMVPLSVVQAKVPENEVAEVPLTWKMKAVIILLAWLGLMRLFEFTWGRIPID